MNREERNARARAFITDGMPKGVHAWADKHYSYDYEMENTMYLVWFDDNPKRDITTKITDAIAAYQLRYGMLPNIALVSELDNAPSSVAGVPTRIEKRVTRNNIQVGYER